MATVSGKEARTGSRSLGRCRGAGVSWAGGWQPGWRQLWGSPSPFSGPAPHSTHNSVPDLPTHGRWPEWGWGSSWFWQSSLCPWGLGLCGAGGSRAQAARAPQAVHGPDLPVAFALVSELQLCKSQPFLCPTTMASAPQTLGQHILLWGAVAPLFIHLLLLGRLPQAAGRAQ